ncbi:MAG: SIMPL domain-containing protein [Betaproteobacteria bacterium]|nr:SIMPL domain-containing protein [Betaproteobacteria bacterium]
MNRAANISPLCRPRRPTAPHAGLRPVAAAFVLAIATASAHAQPLPAEATPREPVVTVSASASAGVANDRLRASLRAEAEHASAATAAAEVNGRIAKALARAKGATGIGVQTSGYSSYQVSERDRPARWRVSQTLTLEGRDFAAMTDLVGALQAETGLLLGGIQFSVSDETQRQAEDGLTQQAIRHWQERAARAAQGLGFPGWRPGRVQVQTGEQMRAPYPVMRAAASPAAGGAPVAFEAGTTEITVTVSGEAVQDSRRASPR